MESWPQNVVFFSAPETQDEGVWKYEHLRQFCMELNGLAVALQSECQPENCSQMTATEQWIFLCAAHKTPKECPAIDYTRHTLDGAACLLNSNKYFPSRVSIKVFLKMLVSCPNPPLKVQMFRLVYVFFFSGILSCKIRQCLSSSLPNFLTRLLPPSSNFWKIWSRNTSLSSIHCICYQV